MLTQALEQGVIEMNIEPIKIANEFGKLVAVQYYCWEFEKEPPIFGACCLSFENGEVYHEVLPEYDEISCATSLLDKFEIKKNMSDVSPWRKALGKKVLWLWKLENHQGYFDSIQYSFANTVEDEEIILQLMVCASQIKLYEIEKKL